MSLSSAQAALVFALTYVYEYAWGITTYYVIRLILTHEALALNMLNMLKVIPALLSFFLLYLVVSIEQ